MSRQNLDKKVPIYSFFKQASIYIFSTGIDLLQSYGANTEMRTLLRTLPAKHLQVALNTQRLLSFLQHSNMHLLLTLSCKYG